VHLQLQRCQQLLDGWSKRASSHHQPITINGYSSATLAGNSTTFRIFQVNVRTGI